MHSEFSAPLSEPRGVTQGLWFIRASQQSAYKSSPENSSNYLATIAVSTGREAGVRGKHITVTLMGLDLDLI